jgi:hypothetical protein
MMLILSAIQLSGDGKSAETAFRVNDVPEEYRLMEILGIENIKSRRTEYPYDIFKVVPTENYDAKEVFFRVKYLENLQRKEE